MPFYIVSLFNAFIQMSRLWHLMLLCWAWSPLCLSSSASFTGTPQECETAHFVPGYNLGGEGFDMERKGAYVIDTETWKLGSNGSCRLYRNSYMKGEKWKVPLSVVDWRNLPKCSLMASSILYDSVEALVKDSTSSVSNDWKVGPVGVDFGGSHSKESIFGMRKSKQDRYTFSRHSIHCQVYRWVCGQIFVFLSCCTHINMYCIWQIMAVILLQVKTMNSAVTPEWNNIVTGCNLLIWSLCFTATDWQPNLHWVMTLNQPWTPFLHIHMKPSYYIAVWSTFMVHITSHKCL